jgi:hypothetical protein
MSRCTTPAAWAQWSARHACTTICTVASSDSRRSRSRRHARSSPRSSHHDEGLGLGADAEIEDLDQVRVIELGEAARLLLEALPSRERARAVGVQHLDGHLAAEGAVPRQPDAPHSAGAELALEQQVVGEHLSGLERHRVRERDA